MGRKTALEDNGQEGTKRLKELSINTQGNDGIHTAAAVCLCAADGGVGGSWPQRRKVNLDTTENNPFPLAVSAITGGRRLGEGWREGKRRREGGRKGREKGRRERKGGGSVLSAEDFLPCLYMVSSPPFFRLPSPDSDLRTTHCPCWMADCTSDQNGWFPCKQLSPKCNLNVLNHSVRYWLTWPLGYLGMNGAVRSQHS